MRLQKRIPETNLRETSVPFADFFDPWSAIFPAPKGRGCCSGLSFKRRNGPTFDSTGIYPHGPVGTGMPACTQNVKKRKARRIKNDRLQAAKKAAKAQG